MTEQSLHSFTLPNGLTLLVEEMPHVQSAAFSVLTPAGAIYEPAGKNGTAAACCDLMTRGAGDRDSRQLSDALDNLGVQRSENVGWNFLTFSGATLASNLLKALPIYADILRRPRLPAKQFSAVISGVEQSLLAEEDEPQRKVFVELRRCCYDSPWSRPTDGTLAELPAIRHRDVTRFYESHVRPNGTLIGVAGNVQAEAIRQAVEEAFGDWEPGSEPQVAAAQPACGSRHLHHDSAQTHIGLAYRAVPYGHEDYYAAWAAVSVLSGGSSSRLFTEVREKRGLCYSVYATLNSLVSEGRLFAYAGSLSERAQETLDVMLQVMRDLPEGITQAELERCRARAKSSLIMQQESTGARASSIARDWFHLQKMNTLADVRAAIDALTVEQITDYARRFPARDVSVLTIGPQPLKTPGD